MIAPPLLKESASRDRFLKALARQRFVCGVAGEDGLARRPSRKFRGREASLFWEDQDEAARWAEAVAQHPRIKRYTLDEMLSDILPGLARHRRLIGLGWNGSEVEVELDPTDFGERLRLAALDAFLSDVCERGTVFTLEDAGGPALLVSQTRSDVLVLPCWANAGEAHARIEGPWRDMMVIETPLKAFIQERLVWLARNGHLIGPDYKGGPGALEMQPEDLQDRLHAFGA